MRKTISYLLATLLCFSGCVATHPAPQNLKEQTTKEESKTNTYLDEWFIPTTIENDPYPSICSLHLEDGKLLGSGILIRPDVVLTAGHCIDDNNIFSVVIGEEEIMVKEIILYPSYSDTFGRIRNDIGLIFLECESIYEPAIMGCVEWMTRYQDITTVGHSCLYKKYSKPSVFRYFGVVLEEPNEMKFIPRPASVLPGDSGGGVFAKFKGKEYVVGIISNYTVITIFKDEPIISECSATIIANYVDWIEMEVVKNEIRTLNKITKDGR
jgi:hypothetical protein